MPSPAVRSTRCCIVKAKSFVSWFPKCRWQNFWPWLSLKPNRANVGVLLRARRCAGLEQVSLNKLIDVAIENGVGITNLDAGAVIFDHAVRMEHIGANLAAPRDIFLGLVIDLHLFLLFLDLQLVQTGAQNLHRHCPVFML